MGNGRGLKIAAEIKKTVEAAARRTVIVPRTVSIDPEIVAARKMIDPTDERQTGRTARARRIGAGVVTTGTAVIGLVKKMAENTKGRCE